METPPPEPPEQPPETGGFTNSLWLSADEFCADHAAVKAWREFIASPAGVKLRRVIAGLNPLARLATLDTLDPKLIRAVSSAETQSEGSLLGKSIGYQAIDNLLFQRLVKIAKPQQKPTGRKGNRSISPHQPSLPV